MSLSIERPEGEGKDAVGAVLIRVQDDLRHLREELLAQARTGGATIDINTLDAAIARTERGLKDHADHVVQLSNDRVTQLPAVTQQQPRNLAAGPSRRHAKARTAPPLCLSPGQEAQLRLMGRLMGQPTHPTTRQLLSDTFGVAVPHSSSHRRRTRLPPGGHLAAGTTISHLTTLPQAHRRDALLTPPPISTGDAQRGLLSLLERGLIPRAAEIMMHPPPVQPRPVQLHSPSTLYCKATPVDSTDCGAALVGVKFDPVVLPSHGVPKTSSPVKAIPHHEPCHAVKRLHLPSAVLPPEEVQEEQQPSSMPERRCSYTMTIRNGVLVEDPDLTSFREYVESSWAIVIDMIRHVETMGKQYAIPIIFVDGHRVQQLAEEYVLEPHPSHHELLRCVQNRRDVEQLLKLPGRRFKGHGGLHAAATKIQATYRMYVQRCYYLEHRSRQWAAGVIAMAWLLHMKATKMRKLLQQARADHLSNYRARLKKLGASWPTVSQERRVVIHLPSKGYPEQVRRGEKQFLLSQGLQMVRVSDAADPLVEVIYISSVEVEEEVQHYYRQLLDMSGERGGEGGGGGVWDRVHIVTPEHVHSFKQRNMGLASLLKYSPRTVARIHRLIGGRLAYLVPQHSSRDDLEVADKLGVPVLGVEPQLANLYSTHSGRTKLFAAAGVAIPPSAEEVHSLEQLVEQLSMLVTAHLAVRRWLFKIDHYPGGKGFAYCNITEHLECYGCVVRERVRYGEKWSRQWARESSRKKVMHELPSILALHASPVDKTLFPTWAHYMQRFLISGGSIEASPPSDSVTSVSADLLLSPDGTYSFLSTSDLIHSSPYVVWGGSLPQASVDHSQLAAAVNKVAEAAQSRGIVGYLSVDLLTFIHPDTMCQELWAVDIDFGPSDTLVMQQLMTSLTTVQFSADSGQLIASQGKRYAVLSCRLRHTNLSIVQHDVFFRMCKAHLIGYHAESATGTLFNLVGGSRRQRLGMICIQPSLSKALSSSSTTLSIIHQEITTPHVQGSSNLPAVYREMESVATLVAENGQELS